ncbi:MAG: hypothetical protein PHI85_07225 [Victivallaceae bacterium]|nr:hypothetical protein [Victivallaceae bacterium]
MNNSDADKLARFAAIESRYSPGACDFVVRAVEVTAARLKKPRHLTATELLSGIARFARSEFGVFDADVFNAWGVHKPSDFGNIVYSLIGAGMLSAGENDRREDFDLDIPLTLPQERPVPITTAEIPKID